MTMTRGRRLAQATLARALATKEKLPLAEWVEEYRYVSADSGSPFPGKWRNSTAPYLAPIMAVLDAAHPASEIVIMKSAQVGVTEVALNKVLETIHQNPAPMIYMLPTQDEAAKFNSVKLHATLESSPAVRDLIVDVSAKGKPGTTSTIKKFPGGSLIIVAAGSSSQLQMISAKYLLADEVSNYPDATDDRGDPVAQAQARLTAYRRKGAKEVYFSTPGDKARCRITKRWEVSDQRKLFSPCPECGDFLHLAPEALRTDRDKPPYGAHVFCPSCGSRIGQEKHDQLVHTAVFIATYADPGDEGPGGWFPAADLERWKSRETPSRQPGFYVWQANSPFVTWESIAKALAEAKTTAQKAAVRQQVLGLASETTSAAAPDADQLYLRRGDRPRGIVPNEAHVLTGAIDVQGDRLEWAVYGWSGSGPSLTPWLVDWGVVPGRPDEAETWAALDLVRSQVWPDDQGRDCAPDGWAIDAAFKSPHVFHHVAGRSNIIAVRGESSQGGRLASAQPIFGGVSRVDYDMDGKRYEGGGALYRMGKWQLEDWLQTALNAALSAKPETEAPALAIRLCAETDLEFCAQLCSAALETTFTKAGNAVSAWKTLRTPNEQRDLAEMNRFMAEVLGLPKLTPDQWTALREAQGRF